MIRPALRLQVTHFLAWQGWQRLTVWRFDPPYGARNALDLVERLRKEALLQLDDAAIVTWPDDRKKPKTEAYSREGVEV